MRTIAIIIALILSLIAGEVFASEDIKKAGRAKLKIELPPMNFGSPEEVDTDELRRLKSKLISLPEMNWGRPEEVVFPAGKAISLPAMNWGSPEDVDKKALEILRIREQISLPPMNWGSPEEVIIK